VVSAGTLGILIPPSTIFIIYGIMAEQSIGKLFSAGVLPGLMLTILLAGVLGSHWP
jgi:C4-dicarboxylate transporter DctM subunit